MRIGLIAPSDAHLVWGLAAPLLEKSMPYSGGRYDTNTLFNRILAGEQNLWLVSERPREPIAAFTTTVITYPTGFKALSCQFCGGDNRMDEWIEQADDILNRFAKDAGCQIVEMTGRKGWSRKLPAPWEQEFVLYRRQVTTHAPPPLEYDPPEA